MSFIQSAWSRAFGAVKDNLGPIVIVAGAISYSATLIIDSLTPKEASVVTGIGSALLAGGIFAWITKTMQISGVFREELEKVIYGSEHLATRSDRQALWSNATRSLGGATFKDIDDSLHKAIVERFLPLQTRFYYQGAYREMTFELEDAADQVVKVSSYFRAIMRTDRANAPIVRKRVVLLDPLPNGGNALIGNPISEYVLEDGSQISTKSSINVSSLPSGETQIDLNTELDGRHDYDFSDRSVYKQWLLASNGFLFEAISYIDGMDVHITYDPRLNIQFYPIGGALFRDVGSSDGHIRKRSQDLMFKGTGYMVTVQTRKDASK